MGYTGNNHHARKEEMIHDRELIYDAKKQLHRADESYKHSPSKMYGDPAAKMNGSMKSDQSDQHIDYKNYKGTDKGYHGSTGSSHGDQSNIFHDYEKHPSKMYGDPAAKNITKVLSEGAKHNAAPKMYDDAAPKFNAGLRAASADGKLSGKFKQAVDAAPKMAGQAGHNVLAEDMTPDSQSIVGGDMGYAGGASGAPAPMMEALGKPALMMKKGIASMCGMKK